MREFYACQLDLCGDQSDAESKVLEWIRRPSLATTDELTVNGGRSTTVAGHEIEISAAGEGDRGWTCNWTFPERAPADADSGSNLDLFWRFVISLGPNEGGPEGEVEAPSSTRFTLRAAVGTQSVYQLAPPSYEFRSPAIVRTLLRGLEMYDGAVRVEPVARLCGPGDVSSLVDLLLHDDRRLPVLVITLQYGRPLANPSELGRQLAGLAHVVVLTSNAAARLLTDHLGAGLSVWGGAVRLYWPGMSLDDGPSRHRFWTSTRLLNSITDFVDLQRNWLGGLAAATIPEHPATLALRAERRQRLADGHVPPWLQEYLDQADQELDADRAQIAELQNALSEAQRTARELDDELRQVRRQFRLVQTTLNNTDEMTGAAGGGAFETDLDEPTSDETGPSPGDEADWVGDGGDGDGLGKVERAFQQAVTEAGSHVVYLPSAYDSIKNFTTYAKPRRLYQALDQLNAAAELWAAGQLTVGFGAHFHDRGYTYAQKNPSARDRTKRHLYRREWNNATVTMEPHLKVDENTSPDQCLRIYWYIDEAAKILVVGHVGRHLP